ncbi:MULTISPECIES: MBL fold metallo-hydrolase [Nostoc]|uniref:MBL fold metallo-hydrolase n=2 Tax=Nostoc TaxID=1177 RepID=A0ABR8IEL5_9NOSO|nr:MULTISPECIES: MBL fold metallo-hydrolase [Nostoc]MBD2563519.1 MBL fold metallo-hydrolase [Nostoc linckia FACHB-391]MBD2649324.1 MBL fold metallo-hydrolase [Nostoc foliaceum FACHB-393]
MCPLPQQPSHTTKPPRAVFPNEVPSGGSMQSDFAQESIFAFPPNRDTLGGTSYLIVRNEGNILIDCPALDQTNQDFLGTHGGVRWLFLTHRGAIGKTAEIQQVFGCEILIQEQEAYLLPGLTPTTFSQEFTLDASTQVIWTPGHSPGSSCLYYSELGGILFSGRHLVPNQQGKAVPLRTAKTFHWPRQINSLRLLLERFTPETLRYICPGANTGFLRGKRVIDQGYQHIASLDLLTLLRIQPLI